MAQGALTAATAGLEVVPASEYRALEQQVRELHRLLGKKAMENELLRETVPRAAGPKKTYGPPPPQRDFEWHDWSASTYPVSRIFASAKMDPTRFDANKLRGASTTFLTRISKRRFDRYAIFCHLHRHRERPMVCTIGPSPGTGLPG